MNSKRVRYSVLVIDDNQDDHFFIKDAFQTVSLEINVTSVFTGLEGLGKLALAILESENPLPDLIICDINMPIMDGVTFLEHIKTSTHYKKIPVVILSTAFESETIQRLLLLGALDCIIKPDYSKNYRTIIASILNKTPAFDDL